MAEEAEIPITDKNVDEEATSADENEQDGTAKKPKKSRLKKWLILLLLLLIPLLCLLFWRFQDLPPRPPLIENIISNPTSAVTHTPVSATETKITNKNSTIAPTNTPLPAIIETPTPESTVIMTPNPTPTQQPVIAVSTPNTGPSRKELEATVETLKYAWATDSAIQSENFQLTTEASAATSDASFYATLTAQPTETSTGTPTETRTPTTTPTQTPIPPSLTPTPTETSTGTPIPTATVTPTPIPTATFPPL